MIVTEAASPNQRLHLTVAATLVSRDTELLQRPRQASLVGSALSSGPKPMPGHSAVLFAHGSGSSGDTIPNSEELSMVSPELPTKPRRGRARKEPPTFWRQGTVGGPFRPPVSP